MIETATFLLLLAVYFHILGHKQWEFVSLLGVIFISVYYTIGNILDIIVKLSGLK